MLFLFVIDYFENKHKTRVNITTIYILVLLSLLSGLRGDMGLDLSGYSDYFDKIPALSKVLFYGEHFDLMSLEPLYVLFVSTFKVFSTSFNYFLFFQSLVLLIIVVVSLKRFNAPVNICLILYFFLFYLDVYGQQRMTIVYVLCLFATTYLARNDLKKFVAVVLTATLFQYTAIFFLPAYWIRYILLKRVNVSQHICRIENLGTGSTAVIDGRFKDTKKLFLILNRFTLIKVAFLLCVALFVTLQVNIFDTLYESLWPLTSTDSNVYSYKFLSYYERIDTEQNIANAWVGLTAYVVILAFLYLFRKRWIDPQTTPMFVNFAVGLSIFILVYKFPWLGDRVFQMYSIAATVVILGTIASQRKDSKITLPVIFAVCVYRYLHFIDAIGPYKLITTLF